MDRAAAELRLSSGNNNTAVGQPAVHILRGTHLPRTVVKDSQKEKGLKCKIIK